MIDTIVELFLCFFFGYLGAHKFFRGKTGLGVLYLCTFGLFVFGWAIDSILISIKLVKLIKKKKVENAILKNEVLSPRMPMPLPDETDSRKLNENQCEQNRHAAEQRKIDERKIALRLLAERTPLTVTHVSKIGKTSKSYEYHMPYDAEIGDIVLISEDIYNESERDVFVVSHDRVEIGEISMSAAKKIADEAGSLEETIGLISHLDLDDEPPKITVSLYKSSTFRFFRFSQLEKEFNLISFKIAGVTHDNDDGQSRQMLLKRYKNRGIPFNDNISLSLQETTFNGDPAIKVVANDNVLGFVPKDRISEILDAWENIEDIDGIDVYGGQEGHSFGAEVTIKVRRV